MPMAHPVIGIIGGGPAGLFCAANIRPQGFRIILFEKKREAGRKLLITGSGRCNLTHGGDIRKFEQHYGEKGAFLKPALRGYTNREIIAFFEERGCPLYADENEKIFPVSEKADDILSVLISACRENNVMIRQHTPVRAVERTSTGFLIQTEWQNIRADILVIATGGASYPSTGSTGDGYRFAKSLGHTITAIGPALAPVYPDKYPFSDLAGISFDEITVSILREGRVARKVTGDLLLTHNGLSGPVILHASRYIRDGDSLRIAFLPEKEHNTIASSITLGSAAAGKRLVKTILSDLPLPARFIQRLTEEAGLSPDCTVAHLSREKRKELLRLLTGWTFLIKSVGGFDQAMATRGGVSLEEINNKTMESRLLPGLYCIGEVLDIDGDSGGYNLQAAFSTAYAAARSISGKIETVSDI
ncbi:NAD(P)/FAD-dependent oxidoreductase [Methanocalculus taiwanensis]|nr:NAD(P)/FAD-dependent oxidoreductase [Methanocalculus taiwanensis]